MGYAKEKRGILARKFKQINSHMSRFTDVFPLTAAQLIAMHGAPVSVLPAPTSSQIWVVSWLGFEMIRTATPFTGGGALNLQYHTTTSSIPHTGTLPASLLTTAGAATTYTRLEGNTGANGLPVPAGEGIDITCVTGAFAAGTGAANLYMEYFLVELL